MCVCNIPHFILERKAKSNNFILKLFQGTPKILCTLVCRSTFVENLELDVYCRGAFLENLRTRGLLSLDNSTVARN